MVHTSSFNIMKKFQESYDITGLKVLDVGSCDVNGTYKSIFDSCEYTGCDIVPGNNVDIVLQDAYQWKEFEDNSFDVVISGSTFEHIEFPWLTIKEIARVLKPRGLCCIIAPAVWEQHSHPLDCYRYYSDGMVALFKWANLKVQIATTEDAYDKNGDGGLNGVDCFCIGEKI